LSPALVPALGGRPRVIVLALDLWRIWRRVTTGVRAHGCKLSGPGWPGAGTSASNPWF